MTEYTTKEVKAIVKEALKKEKEKLAKLLDRYEENRKLDMESLRKIAGLRKRKGSE